MPEVLTEDLRPEQNNALSEVIRTEVVTSTEKSPQEFELEKKIRVAQFELEGALRRKAQAELELASIQKSYGAPISDYEKLAAGHRESAEKDIEKFNELIQAAKTELSALQQN